MEMGRTFTDLPPTKLLHSHLDLSNTALDEKVFQIDSVQSAESHRELLIDKSDEDLSSEGSNKPTRRPILLQDGGYDARQSEPG